MRIQMLVARVLQDAGRERPLHVGEQYDLPDLIADELISGGAAQLVRMAPERKPRHVPEAKGVA